MSDKHKSNSNERDDFPNQLLSITEELSSSTYKATSELLHLAANLKDFVSLTVRDVLNDLYNRVFQAKCRMAYHNLSVCTELELLMHAIEQKATEYSVTLSLDRNPN